MDVPEEMKHASRLNMSRDEFLETGKEILEKVSTLLARKAGDPIVIPSAPGASLTEFFVGNAVSDVKATLHRIADLLLSNSLFTSHPLSLAYISGSVSPISQLVDLVVSALGCNLATRTGSGVSTDIEIQTVYWIAHITRFIEQDAHCAGTFVSGATIGSLSAIYAALCSSVADYRQLGISSPSLVKKKPRIYATKQVHAWLLKSVALLGLGEASVFWINCDENDRMDVAHLDCTLSADAAEGSTVLPVAVVVTAGTTATGVCDDILTVGDICKKYSVWCHADAAYGGFASLLTDFDRLNDLEDCASIKCMQFGNVSSLVVDPHKWGFVSVESSVLLVRSAIDLFSAFSGEAAYYSFDHTSEISMLHWGIQTSRSDKATKVWALLQVVGLEEIRTTIGRNCMLAQWLFKELSRHPRFEAKSCHLSIVCFRLLQKQDKEKSLSCCRLNSGIVEFLNKSSPVTVFLSSVTLKEEVFLRVCLTNFRTNEKDLQYLIAQVVNAGDAVTETLQREPLYGGGLHNKGRPSRTHSSSSLKDLIRKHSSGNLNGLRK